MSTSVVEAPATWILRSQGAEIMGVPESAIQKLIKDGRLSVRRIPGTPPRVRIDEIERLAAEYTTSAK